MRLSDKRYEEIKIIASDLVCRHMIVMVPLDVLGMARGIGIELKKYSTLSPQQREACMKLSEDGFKITDKGKHIIYYNDMVRVQRIRFTIAHEIAHIVLGHTEESRLAESEANFFAKYILAFPVLIHHMGLDDAEDISCIFDVSQTFAEYALSYANKRKQYGPETHTVYEDIILDIYDLECELMADTYNHG